MGHTRKKRQETKFLHSNETPKTSSNNSNLKLKCIIKQNTDMEVTVQLLSTNYSDKQYVYVQSLSKLIKQAQSASSEFQSCSARRGVRSPVNQPSQVFFYFNSTILFNSTLLFVPVSFAFGLHLPVSLLFHTFYLILNKLICYLISFVYYYLKRLVNNLFI